jgi:peptidoglycan/xylan/chitin deacetylase (PgdA/CDA1 family)
MADVIVLCYHAVSEHWPASQSITPARLEQQLRLLQRRGYRGATFAEAVERPPSDRVMAVTFDDAYRSVFDVARPLLAELGLPGTLFVPTDFVGGEGAVRWAGVEEWLGGPHERELELMGWDEVGELAGSGWEIGSHTRSHAKLTECDDEGLRDELEGSRAAVEARLGAPCRTLAYPFGAVDERVVEATRAAGYAAAGAIPVRFRPPAPLEWPRIGVYHRDGEHPWHFRMKVSPGMRRLRASWLWEVYGASRRALTGR